MKAFKANIISKKKTVTLAWIAYMFPSFPPHSFLQQNFERNTIIIQSLYKHIPAASHSPDNSSILYKFVVCPGNIYFLRHTANCVGLNNITASFLTCIIPVYNSVTQNTKFVSVYTQINYFLFNLTTCFLLGQLILKFRGSFKNHI